MAAGQFGTALLFNCTFRGHLIAYKCYVKNKKITIALS